MIHSLLSVVNMRILLCFAEILMALKAYRATGRADFLPMFFFMFVFLLFAAKESVFMKNSRLLRGAETVLFALMTAAYAGYLPVLPVTLALGAGVAASLFRAPVSFDAENGEAFFNRDYRRFSTYASMLAGALCGSVLSIETALAAMTALCAVRTLASFFEKRQEPDMRFIGARRVISSFAQIRKYAVLCRASFGISWMWATGYLLLVNVDALTNGDVLLENVLIFSAAFSFWGGCAYAKRLARQILDFTLSPLNTAGMTLCLSVLAVLSMYDGVAAKAASLILWSGNAFCAGMYVLPLSLALRTRVRERNFQALVVATKFLNLACFLIALILTAVRYRYGMPVGAIFAFCAVLGAGVLIYNCRISPASFQRALVRTVLEILFHVTVKGQRHFLESGHRVLIAANHMSSIDALLIAAFMPERIAVVLPPARKRSFFEYACSLFADVHILDMKDSMALRPLIALLKSNAKVLVFPEGRSAVTGGLMKIYAGVGVMAQKANASVLPVCISGAQYSKFSLQKEQHKTRWLPKIRLTIMPARKLEVSQTADKRKRNYAVSLQMYRMMTRMLVESFNANRNLVKALWDARDTFGANREIAEDASRHALRYKDLLLKGYVLGGAIANRTRDGEYVGVMMPNVLANVVLFFGLIAADKVPAMLNFSSGPAQILSCLKAVGVRTVISSRAFIEAGKLENVESALKEAGIRILYLEDVASSLTIGDKIRGLGRYFGRVTPRRKADEAAAVLFTSGSEGMPKAVLLSHRNFLINGYQGVVAAGLNPRDVFFNALPMFHSFGLGMATVMTTLHGIKTVYYPSPLHYKIIPELIYDTNATVLVGTDTFLAGYGEAAHPYDFYSLRLAIVGAEKLKESTEKLYIEKFCIRVIEGYGATECSPLISVNSRMYNRRGSVGRIVPALDYKLEEAAGITDGKRLLLKGGNVMMGYMRPENPRVLEPVKDGWYDTGDIVEVDDEDFIFIKGRAKRFAKVGGEMISLGAIEGAVNGLYPDAQNAVVAVADAKKGEKLVLFTTRENADAFEIKKYVREKGLSDLGVPSKIVVLAEIPLLSSGKVDYPTLQTMAAA